MGSAYSTVQYNLLTRTPRKGQSLSRPGRISGARTTNQLNSATIINY